MFKTNEYFEGNVKSLAFSSTDYPATVGVMAKGEYEFGTSSVEIMTVISGAMTILLPGDTEWREFKPFDTFRVEKGQKFRLRIPTDTAYLCIYK